MTTASTLQLSDLIFSDSKTDFNRILGELKKSTLSLKNRLRSIEQDAAFAALVAEVYQLPLVANERCGSWYIPPSAKGGSAYFKSTDGHMSQWSFSLRRLNLQVLEIIVDQGGCIVVDSTRRGKSMPDALSKTVPIWTCVLNRFFFPDRPDCHDLRTPPGVVGASEHAQIEARVDAFTHALTALKLDFDIIRGKLVKPLRPIWVTPEFSLPSETPVYEDFYPVVCCTTSRRILGGEASEGGYIQGAGDDAESWAHGLTAPLFWANRDRLARCSEEELVPTVEQMVEEAGIDKATKLTAITPADFLRVGTIEDAEASIAADASGIVVTVAKQPSAPLQEALKSRYCHLSCPPGKVGSRQLRHELQSLLSFLLAELAKQQASTQTAPRIIVACPSGKDHSIGAALAILCLFCDDAGAPRDVASLDKQRPVQGLSKQIIKQRLSWLSVNVPEAIPSRATLQSVNAFLLG